MNNLIIFFRFKRIYVCAFLSFIYVFTFAQKTSTIKGVKTDNSYANTTEISKSKNATDEQVLAEIEGNYGIGDIVRIVESTPKPTIDPLAKRGNDKPVETHISTSTLYQTKDIVAPTISLTQSVPPIHPKSAPQQPTAPPQYIDKKELNIDAPNIFKAEPNTPNLPSKTLNIDNPTRDMLIPTTRIDGTPIGKESALITEKITQETVKEKISFEQKERIESKASSQTNHTYSTSSSSRVSKKSGISVKKMSSLFKKTSYNKAKHRKIKNKQKDKCYKF
jgi:hypothetical protein